MNGSCDMGRITKSFGASRNIIVSRPGDSFATNMACRRDPIPESALVDTSRDANSSRRSSRSKARAGRVLVFDCLSRLGKPKNKEENFNEIMVWATSVFNVKTQSNHHDIRLITAKQQLIQAIFLIWGSLQHLYPALRMLRRLFHWG
jgi:hypothetical protein